MEKWDGTSWNAYMLWHLEEEHIRLDAGHCQNFGTVWGTADRVRQRMWQLLSRLKSRLPPAATEAEKKARKEKTWGKVMFDDKGKLNTSNLSGLARTTLDQFKAVKTLEAVQKADADALAAALASPKRSAMSKAMARENNANSSSGKGNSGHEMFDFSLCKQSKPLGCVEEDNVAVHTSF